MLQWKPTFQGERCAEFIQPSQERCWRAVKENLPLLENNNLVTNTQSEIHLCISQDNRSALLHPAKYTSQLLLGRQIHCCRGFIKEKNRRLGYKNRRQGNSLSLSAREARRVPVSEMINSQLSEERKDHCRGVFRNLACILEREKYLAKDRVSHS